MIHGGEIPKSPNQIAHFDDNLAGVCLDFLLEGHGSGQGLLRRRLMEQHHEAIFKPRGRGIYLDSAKRAVFQGSFARAILISDEAHQSGFGDSIDYPRFVQQARLKSPRLLARARLREISSLGRLFSNVRRRPLSQHPTLAENDDLGTSFRLVQIRGAEKHGQPLIRYQVMDDLPQFSP